jgi:hypothetical protein
MRGRVSQSGEKVLDLEHCDDALMKVGAVVADGGATEACIARHLQEEKTEIEKDKALSQEQITKIIQLPCHKHKLSLITKKAQQTIVTEIKADPFDLEMKIAKAYKATSGWGYSKGLSFDEFCGKVKGQSELKGVKPPKRTRHHLRLRSMAHLYLVSAKLIAYIKKHARKARRGKGEARGEEETNQINK